MKKRSEHVMFTTVEERDDIDILNKNITGMIKHRATGIAKQTNKLKIAETIIAYKGCNEEAKLNDREQDPQRPHRIF